MVDNINVFIVSKKQLIDGIVYEFRILLVCLCYCLEMSENFIEVELQVLNCDIGQLEVLIEEFLIYVCFDCLQMEFSLMIFDFFVWISDYVEDIQMVNLQCEVVLVMLIYGNYGVLDM